MPKDNQNPGLPLSFRVVTACIAIYLAYTNDRSFLHNLVFVFTVLYGLFNGISMKNH